MPPKAKGSPGGLEVSRLSVRVTADVSSLLGEIRRECKKIEKAVKVTVKVDGNLEPLRKRLDEFRKTQGDRVLKLKVTIDLSAIRRQLAEFRLEQSRRPINIPVNGNTGNGAGNGNGRDVDRARSLFERLRKSAVDALGDAVTGFVKFGAAGTAALSVLPLLIAALGAVAQVAAGVGIVAAAGFAALAAGAITAVIALKPVVEALTAYKDQASQAAANSKALAAAQQSLTAAQERLADAQVDGPKRVAAAERALVDAQKRATTAQEAVTAARKAAAQALEDLQLQLSGAAIDEDAAALAVEEARNRLNEVNADPLSTDLEVGDAVIGLRQAQQRLEELRASNERLRESATAAQAAGVDGAKDVLDAQDAQADAAQGLVDAQDAVTTAQRDSARETRDAAAALADAAAGLSEAQQKTTDFEAALGKLTPAGRAVVDTITSFFPAFRELRNVVQDNLFRGLPESISNALSTLLPVLTEGLGQVASGLGSVFGSVLDTFASNDSNLANFLANTGAGFAHLADAVSPFLTALFTIGSVASDFFPRIADAIADVSTRFADFVQAKADSGELSAFIDKALDGFATLGRIIGDLGSALGGIFGAANGAAGPGGILGTIELLTGGLSGAVKAASASGVLTDFFAQLQTVFNALMPVISTVVSVIGTTIVPIFANLITALAPGVVAFLTALGQGLQPLIPVATLVGQALGAVLTALAPLLPALGNLVATLLGGLAGIVLALAPSLGVLAGILAEVAQTLVDSLTPVLPEIVEGFRMFAEICANNASVIGDLLVAVVPLLPELLNLAVSLLPLLNANMQGFIAVIGILTPLIPPLVSLISAIIGPVTDAAQFFAKMTLQIQESIKAVGGFGEIGKGAINAVIDVLNLAVSALNVLIHGLNSLSDVTKYIGITFEIPDIPKIPHLARGGMTSGPTTALIGDNPSGNELVAPLDSPRTVDLLSAAMGQALGRLGGSGGGASDADLETRIEAALRGWSVTLDPRGVARLTKKGNARDAWVGGTS